MVRFDTWALLPAESKALDQRQTGMISRQCFQVVLKKLATFWPETTSGSLDSFDAIDTQIAKVVFCFAPYRQQPDIIEHRQSQRASNAPGSGFPQVQILNIKQGPVSDRIPQKPKMGVD